MQLLLDIGAQRLQCAPHRDVQQPGLRPNQQRCNQIHDQRQGQSSGNRPEVNTPAWDHIHPGQQVGKGVVAAGPRGRDGLILGDAGGQLSAHHAIE